MNKMEISEEFHSRIRSLIGLSEFKYNKGDYKGAIIDRRKAIDSF